MLKIKDNVDLKELEKFGFKTNFYGVYIYNRLINDVLAWRCFITKNHHNIQIEVFEHCVMAKELQCLLYDLIKADLVEKVGE